MALGTGQLSLADIAGEYGGSAPHALSEYRGVSFSDGSYAPSSGTISLNNFRNKSKYAPPREPASGFASSSSSSDPCCEGQRAGWQEDSIRLLGVFKACWGLVQGMFEACSGHGCVRAMSGACLGRVWVFGIRPAPKLTTTAYDDNT